MREKKITSSISPSRLSTPVSHGQKTRNKDGQLSSVRRDSESPITAIPKNVSVENYEPGSCQLQKLRLKNYSTKTQRISVKPIKSKYFRLRNSGKEIKDYVDVAPGLFIDLEIDFKAPKFVDEQFNLLSSGNNLSEKDQSQIDIHDELVIDILGKRSLSLPLNASPAGPVIEFDSDVNFGTVVLAEDIKSVAKSKFVVEFRNTGKRRALLDFAKAKKDNVTIIPETLILGSEYENSMLTQLRSSNAFNLEHSNLPTSASITVEFTPEEIGAFQETVNFDILRISPSTLTSSSAKLSNSIIHKHAIETLICKGNVVNHKISVRSANDSLEFNADDVDFGSIFYGQNAEIPIFLNNESDSPLKWTITYSEESAPNVPDNFDANRHLKLKKDIKMEAKAAIGVSPAEGLLAPRQKTEIKFLFSPKLPPMTKGFSRDPEIIDSTCYSLPMQLKIVGPAGNSGKLGGYSAGEEPIDILLQGNACPLDVILSERSLQFPPTSVDECNKLKFTMKNRSELPTSFDFEKIAHFQFLPSNGTLQPNQVQDVEVSFKPNQLGRFHTNAHVYFSAKGGESGTSKKGAYTESRVLKIQGDCLPGVLKQKLISDSLVTPQPLASQPRARNIEREEFVGHRKLYDEYIRGSRLQKEKDRHVKYLGEEITGISLPENTNTFDSETGLVIPEPKVKVDEDTFKYQSFSIANNDSESDDFKLPVFQDQRKLKELFEKLQQNTLMRPKPVSRKSGCKSDRNSMVQANMMVDEPLLPSDLACIFVSKGVIDFGEVTVHSNNTAVINFLNLVPSNKSVHIALVPEESKRGTSVKISPASTVIEPMSLFGFEISLQSHETGVFDQKITYIVNGRYKYSINLKVSIVPLALLLSELSVNMQVDFLSSDSMGQALGVVGETRGLFDSTGYPFAEKTITIRNPGNFPATYRWSILDHLTSNENPVDHGHIRIEPPTGRIAGGESSNVTFRYFPGLKPELEMVLQFEVLDEYGDSESAVSAFEVFFRGQIPASKCSVGFPNGKSNSTMVDFGKVPIIYSQELVQFNPFFNDVPFTAVVSQADSNFPRHDCASKVIKLKNMSPNSCFYSCQLQSKLPHIRISPSSGILGGDGSTVEIQLLVNAKKCGMIDDNLLISIVGGGKTIKIPLRYDAVEPQIFVDFGELQRKPIQAIVGSTTSKTIKIGNKGDATSRVVFDLRSAPFIEFILRQDGDSLALENRLIALDKTSEFYAYDGRRSAANAEDSGSIFVFDVLPEEVLGVDVVFKPKKECRYEAQTPFSVVGQPSTALPVITMSAIGIPALVKLSRTFINFKNKVVFQLNDNNVNNYFHRPSTAQEILTLENVGTKNIEFYFDNAALSSCENAFKCDATKGVIPAKGSTSVIISFHPHRSGEFKCDLPVYFDYSDRNSPFIVNIRGTGVEPSLAFDPPEVFLPLTAVTCETVATFSIINYGCERSEIKYAFPDDVLQMLGQLEFSFPEGSILKSDGERLTLMLKFKPNTSLTSPISFSSKIAFFDTLGRKFSLPIQGQAETSSLTLHPFFWMNNGLCSIKVKPEDKDTVIVEKAQRQSLDENKKSRSKAGAPRQFKTPYGFVVLEDEMVAGYQNYLIEASSRVLTWLKNFIREKKMMDNGANFPNSFISSSGALLLQLIGSLTDSPLPPFKLTKPSRDAEKENVEAKYLAFLDLLNYLKELGIHCTLVKPQFLMSSDDYQKWVRVKEDNARATGSFLHEEDIEYYSKTAKYFDILSKEAWVNLLFQALRVMVLEPVTYKKFKSMPGVGRDEHNLSWGVSSKGSVYSQGEGSILKWLSYHSYKRTGTVRRIINFSEDLRDFTAFAHAILSHLPSFENGSLLNFNWSPVTTEECRENAQTLIKTLNVIYGEGFMRLSAEDLMQGNVIDMLLLSSLLFQSLPQFLAKSTIEFKGNLHQKVTKLVEMANPGCKPILYVASLEGSDEFSLEETTVYLPPKARATLVVNFKSRFMKSSQCQLVIKSQQMALNSCSIIVYNLKGSVEKSLPQNVFQMESPLYTYPPKSMDVPITNPFATRATFNIEMLHDKKTDSAQDVAVLSPPTFQLGSTAITLEGNETKTVPVSFLPFELGTHECTLHFSDEEGKVGEFLYQVQGRGLAPSPIEGFQWNCKVNMPVEKVLKLSHVNAVRDKAVTGHLQTEHYTKILNSSKSKKDQHGLLAEKAAYSLPKKALRYKIEYSSSSFKGPYELTIRPGQEQRKNAGMFEAEGTGGELPLTFVSKAPGKYSCTITLYCQDLPDVRVYQINCVSIMEGYNADIELITPARQPVTQELPIVNKSKEDWPFRATIQGQCFSCPSSITVRSNTAVNFPVTFNPIRNAEFFATLTLTNAQNGQRHVYNFRGVGQEPLPDGHVKIQCRCRQKIVHKVVIQNNSEHTATFEMLTALPFVKGQPVIQLKGREKLEYELEVDAKKSGTFKDSIYFYNRAEDTYIWYSAELIASQPLPEKTIRLKTRIREPINAYLTISNVLQEKTTFDIEVKGPGLKGKPVIELSPGEKHEYCLTYSPVNAGSYSGKVVIFNKTIGEFWFDISLEAEELPLIKLEDMTCPVGKCTTQQFFIQNPLDEPTTLSISLTNSRDFRIVRASATNHSSIVSRQIGLQEITLRPLENCALGVVYEPSSFTETQSTSIRLCGDAAGSFLYKVQGMGTLPEVMDEVKITARVGVVSTGNICFVNPLLEPVSVTVTLDDSKIQTTKLSDVKPFSLIANRAGSIFVDGNRGKLNITYSFNPLELVDYVANIVVTTSDNLKWVYPIRGIAERLISKINYTLTAPCRQHIVEVLDCNLPGIKDDDNVVCRFEPDQHNQKELLERSLTVGKLNFEVTPSGAHAKIQLRLSPQRLFTTTGLLIIEGTTTQSRWIRPLQLIATPPQPDDKIIIDGTLNHKSTIAFQLSNPTTQSKPFTAYFTKGSASEFSVQPKTGTLIPDSQRLSSHANEFIISYHPTVYGKNLSGMLIIETDDMCWAYQVQGTV